MTSWVQHSSSMPANRMSITSEYVLPQQHGRLDVCYFICAGVAAAVGAVCAAGGGAHAASPAAALQAGRSLL